MKQGEFEQKAAKVTKGNQEWDFSGSGFVVSPDQQLPGEQNPRLP